VQGRREGIAALANEGVVSVLHAVEERRIHRPKAWRTMIIFAAALAAAAADLLPLPVAVILGAFLVFATRCISPADAYREIDWRVIILIACMLALGQAMSKTGTAHYLAGLVANAASGHSPVWVLSGFFLLTVGLTQPMSNQAAAAVILPIAVQTAITLGLNPRSFCMAIAVAASCSYITPLEPACLMVYGPGRYKFGDFVRVGGLLVILLSCSCRGFGRCRRRPERCRRHPASDLPGGGGL
jgi:di/tricarboxylate transporter